MSALQLANAAYKKIMQSTEILAVDEYNLTKEKRPSVHEEIKRQINLLDLQIRDRVFKEFFSFGPLCELLANPNVTEIIVNSPSEIWFEQNGLLHRYHDIFYSDTSYRNILENLLAKANVILSLEKPIGDGAFENFRLSAIMSCLTGTHTQIALRRHPNNPWNLSRLVEAGWCNSDQAKKILQIFHQAKSFLIIGGTGSGKTSLINALLQDAKSNQRWLIIEDSSEISLPNSASSKLLTRTQREGAPCEITQTDLVKAALRLRPDRIIMGEIRGNEAKDFLMAIATGHEGSFGSLHASDPQQALIRLEMLIQMGAPQWNLSAIRKLIRLSLEYILVTQRKEDGTRSFQGCYRICSLEEQGFLIERVEL